MTKTFKKVFTVRLDLQTYQELDRWAKETQRSKAQLIRMLLELAKELLHEPTAQNAQ